MILSQRQFNELSINPVMLSQQIGYGLHVLCFLCNPYYLFHIPIYILFSQLFDYDEFTCFVAFSPIGNLVL